MPELIREASVTRSRPRVLVYLNEDGPQEVVAEAFQVGAVAFDDVLPIRKIPNRRGQTNTPGIYWCATTLRSLQYESYLEKRWLTLFDYDQDVVAIATQPFLIVALENAGTPDVVKWVHTPDFFLRRSDGSVEIIDVKAEFKLTSVKTQEQRRRTSSLCDELGWDYRLVGEPDPVYWRNVAWLAGFRRPVELNLSLLEEIVAAAREPTPIAEIVDSIGYAPVTMAHLMALCWHHGLELDLSDRLDEHTLVWDRQTFVLERVPL